MSAPRTSHPPIGMKKQFICHTATSKWGGAYGEVGHSGPRYPSHPCQYCGAPSWFNDDVPHHHERWLSAYTLAEFVITEEEEIGDQAV